VALTTHPEMNAAVEVSAPTASNRLKGNPTAEMVMYEEIRSARGEVALVWPNLQKRLEYKNHKQGGAQSGHQCPCKISAWVAAWHARRKISKGMSETPR